MSGWYLNDPLDKSSLKGVWIEKLGLTPWIASTIEFIKSK